MDVVTISDFGKSYQIYNPVEGRIGSKLNMGIPYEHALLRDVYSLNRTGSIFDIGAHIGNHTLYFAAICGLKVYAWEPYPESLKMLYDNLALNDLDVTVFDWAAGAAEGRGRFTKRMWIEFDPSRDGDKLKLARGEVAVHAIDEMIHVDDLAVVKIDVEGMEPDVLRGMLRHLKQKPVIYAETHTNTAMRITKKILHPLGYKLETVIRMGSPMAKWV